uniref:SCP domain-containing protein n=1 Tax=Heterorhabditis bacteriophora TaxID=37862 RepID=A0A1I7XSC3_HETBA
MSYNFCFETCSPPGPNEILKCNEALELVDENKSPNYRFHQLTKLTERALEFWFGYECGTDPVIYNDPHLIGNLKSNQLTINE